MRYQDRERVKRITADAARAERNGVYLWAAELWRKAKFVWGNLNDKSQEQYCKVRAARCDIMAIESNEEDE